MDTKTGKIYTQEQINQRKLEEEAQKNLIDGYFRQIDHANKTQLRRMKVGRNELCPCGSGKKFKKCCIDKKFPDHVVNLVNSQQKLKKITN